MARAKNAQPTKSKGIAPKRQRRKGSTAAARAADKAAADAKAAGAKGARLTAAKQALRDSLIVARAAQDWPVQAIAAEVGLSERQIRNVLKEKRGVRSPLDETPMQLLEDLARGFKLSVGDLEAMAAAYAESTPPVALGAKKAANEARRHFMDLMATVGKLPTDLELFQQEVTLRRVGEQMTHALRELAAGKRSVESTVGLFEELTGLEIQRELSA